MRIDDRFKRLEKQLAVSKIATRHGITSAFFDTSRGLRLDPETSMSETRRRVAACKELSVMFSMSDMEADATLKEYVTAPPVRQNPPSPSRSSYAAGAKKRQEAELSADFSAAALDVGAARRVMAEVEFRRQLDPNFSLNDLERELEQAAFSEADDLERRLDAALAGGRSAPAVTAEDFAVAAQDSKAANKIHAEVLRRRETNPKFTQDDLYRELA